MNAFAPKAKNFWKDEEGVTSIEYALLASLIVVVIAAAVATLGTNILALFEKVANSFP